MRPASFSLFSKGSITGELAAYILSSTQEAERQAGEVQSGRGWFFVFPQKKCNYLIKNP